MNSKQPKARVLAYYLPQFHPIPENDEWWGKGFTEWTNVGKAKPLFPGHYQPHVPADLGYYDLRVPETRQAQADMAREYGVEGFVYWHYWFGKGKQLLERPFKEVLESGKPDFPFALAWANESWSGSFHGLKEGKVLIEQTYPGDEDYIAHFNTVLPALKDHRYITCEGKPMFFLYRPFEMPDTKHFIELWQKLAKDNGMMGIYFVAICGRQYDADIAIDSYNRLKGIGFDAINVVNCYEARISQVKYRFVRKLFYKILKCIPDIRPYCLEQMVSPIDYKSDVIPTVTPNWDHTPRTGDQGIILTGSTPEVFRACVRHFVKIVSSKPFENRFIIIKSWNEWAEGNHMEPDLKYGCMYLEALKNEII